MAFLGIAFAAAWAPELWALSTGARFDQIRVREFLVLAAAMFAPALSALVVRLGTREGFATAGLRVGPWRVFLVVWLGVPLGFAVVYALTVALGLGEIDPTLTVGLRGIYDPLPKSLPSPSVLGSTLVLTTLTAGLAGNCVAAFGEEFGWTGYLLPKLMGLGRWKATLAYGVLWGLWHAPVVWGGLNYPRHTMSGVVFMCLFTTAGALVQAALRIRYGSVFLTTLLHASINSQTRGIWILLVVHVHPFLGGYQGLVGIVVLASVGSWLLARSHLTTTHGGVALR